MALMSSMGLALAAALDEFAKMLSVSKFGIAGRIATMTITVFHGHDTLFVPGLPDNDQGNEGEYKAMQESKDDSAAQ